MTTPIGSATSNTTNSNTTNSNATTGIGSLTSGDFLNLMLTQLEQQDPLDPTDSNAMLSQISQISTLQSNTAMQTSLQGLTLQQSIGAGGNLMGKNITGIDSTNQQVTGNVISVQVQNSQVYLGIDSDSNPVPMSNVTKIAPGVLSSANGTTSAGTTLSGASTTALDNLLTSLMG